jgi:hypothetical protein
MGSKSNFFIAAFIAITFYILTILALIFYLQSSHVKKFQSVSKNTFLELDLIIEETKKNTQNLNKSIQKTVTKESKKVVKKSTARSAKKRADLKSLFARVSTKSSKVKAKSILNIQSNKVNSRFKSKYQKEKRDANLKVSKLLDVKSKENSSKPKTATNKGNFDKYYSKINTIILTRWYNYPLLTNNDYLVVAEITIDAKGKFSYHVISLSGNKEVDAAVKLFLSNQLLERYPVSPDGDKKTIKINFKPDIE